MPFGSSQWMYATGAAVEGQSLRFNDDDSAYLSWTPASAGNRKTWTWSGWVKRGNLPSSDVYLFGNSNGSNQGFHVRFDSGDTLTFLNYPSSASGQLTTSRLFRDTSAWYHIVLVWDTTDATSGDRMRVYINGVRETDFGTSSYPSLNLDGTWNSTSYGDHAIGRNNYNGRYFDGYMAEVNFVDGLALDPTSFGETDANGQWVPIKEPSVTYGTNGFYLPFTNDYSVEGFSTVTYRGNGGTQYIGGVGFEPDLVWVKNRASSGGFHWINDSVRGAGYSLNPAAADTEKNYTAYFTAFNNDGFSLAAGTSGFNASGNSYVAWNWDAGTGSAASNTDGSITSTVKANPDYGFSIVSYTGTGSAATVGHGLSSAPEMVIVKNRDASGSNWLVYHKDLNASGFTAAESFNYLNDTLGVTDSTAAWNDTAPTSSVFSIGTSSQVSGSGNDLIAYCFHSVAGYSDFGSYTGNGSSTGPTVITGFAPAFVMIKRTDSAADWQMYDNVRDTTNPITVTLAANKASAESTFISGYDIDFNSTGFQIKAGPSIAINTSGGTYIYMAFADKREAAFWLDQSGNNNDWTNNNMQESDISLDGPTNNFSTLGPMVRSVRSEGNLRSSKLDTDYNTAVSSIAVSSGKWYAECRVTLDAIYPTLGIADVSSTVIEDTSKYLGEDDLSYGYYSTTWYFNGAAAGSHGLSISDGDVLGVALDLDSAQNTLKIYVNGVLGSTKNINDPVEGYVIGSIGSSFNGIADWNFGQDSSFHGLEVAQGNQDENGFGDFYYAPPAGYLALCSQNLPDPAIADGSEYFNTVLWTGNGTSQSITGVGFQPDFVWGKGRSFTQNHALYDTIRGATKRIVTNSTAAENTETGGVTSFDTDGFSVGNSSSTNSSGNTFVAWNWKADNTSGTSNTDGSITSTVSANTTAGFSIVNYTGNSTAGATVGHGLGTKPDMIIVKDRDGAKDWRVYHSSEGATKYAALNSSAAFASALSVWNNTEPTSSVFTVGLSTTTNTSGSNIIAYCFHSVEGYSKFGSYTGNGSSDGPFVYTGFRPAFVIYKRSDGTGGFLIFDASRNTYNEVDKELFTHSANGEGTNSDVDFLSNGFKLRSTSGNNNTSGGTYIYMAFAENPFKYSNAR